MNIDNIKNQIYKDQELKEGEYLNYIIQSIEDEQITEIGCDNYMRGYNKIKF